MKRLTVLVILAVLLVGVVSLGLSDSAISVADTSAYYVETTVGQLQAGNSSASAAITITMTGVLDQ